MNEGFISSITGFKAGRINQMFPTDPSELCAQWLGTIGAQHPQQAGDGATLEEGWTPDYFCLILSSSSCFPSCVTVVDF